MSAPNPCAPSGRAPHVASFFSVPATGRRIIAGFSHVQRIGKGANTSVWFPEALLSPASDHIEWAAVREYDILQEADNYYIYDMNVGDLKYSLENITKMRAGGYRITILTLGQYTQRNDTDDLKIFDLKLQEEITRMIHFLYLSELSEQASKAHGQDIAQGNWKFGNNLEHVALTLHAKRLYAPEKETLAERTFFQILDHLPARHILHDNAVGLQLPESTKDHIQVYIAKGENQLWQFQRAITNAFEALDKTRAPMTHMRSYGDHMAQGHDLWQREKLMALAA